MLSISTVARVAINASRTAAPPTSFDTGLMLINDANYAASNRLKSYDSAVSAIAGLVGDGFASTTEA